jgi:hypothetical protein
MASELRVDRIIPINGVPTGGAGGVIQMKYTTGVTGSTTTSTSFVDMGIDVTITPTRSDSKFFICWSSPSQQPNTQAGSSYTTIFRNDTTNIGHGTYGLAMVGNYSASETVTAQGTFHVFDAPNTTSAVTYSIYGRSHTGSGTAYITHANSRWTLTVMEVSG